MQSTEGQAPNHDDLAHRSTFRSEPSLRSSVRHRLHAYGILPPGHETMPEPVLVLVEQLFVTWYELGDDDSRRRALRYLIGTEQELRSTLLAVVPLYFDPLYFDERMPTRELIEIVLVAHRKWRAWLDPSRS